MRARFHAEPIIQATELLLQERAPRTSPSPGPESRKSRRRPHARDFRVPAFRQFTSPHDPIPADASALQRALCGDADGGGIRLQPLAAVSVTPMARRRHARPLGDLHLSARRRRAATCGRPAINPRASSRTRIASTFFEDRAEIRRRDGTIMTTLEVLVSPEDDAEVRRVSITNLGAQARRSR